MPNHNLHVAAAISLALSACVGPKYRPPSAPLPAAPSYKESPANYKDGIGWKVAQPNEAMLRSIARWRKFRASV